MFKRLSLVLPALVLCLTLALSACGGSSSSGPVTIKAWFHSGTGAERDVLTAQVAAYNASQKNVKVDLVLLPEGTYNDQVKAAAASNGLPDVLDFDGPNLYNYAWNKSIVPIDKYISSTLKADLLPSIISEGTYNNKLYGIGTFDSGLGLYARKSVLQANNIRIPTGPNDAWTAAEFTQALKTLQTAGYAKPLDLKYNYGKGEWFTYGFSPILQSAGSDLINRSNYQTATGTINSDQSVKALTVFQSWFTNNLVNLNTDDKSFINGQAAISWVGHWQYVDYAKAFSDLVVLPLPDFGKGSKTGSGSWQWGITASSQHQDAAGSFMNYLLQPDEIIRITTANGAVPATKTAVAKSPLFATGGPLNIYIQQLQSSVAIARPQTPAYPTITSAFAKAIDDITKGGDVKQALDEAAKTIDQDIKDNSGYPTK